MFMLNYSGSFFLFIVTTFTNSCIFLVVFCLFLCYMQYSFDPIRIQNSSRFIKHDNCCFNANATAHLSFFFVNRTQQFSFLVNKTEQFSLCFRQPTRFRFNLIALLLTKIQFIMFTSFIKTFLLSSKCLLKKYLEIHVHFSQSDCNANFFYNFHQKISRFVDFFLLFFLPIILIFENLM